MKEIKSQNLVFGNQGMIDALDFGRAFNMARLKAGGAGGVFNWRGKKFTTDFENETWSPTYPNKKKTVTKASPSVKTEDMSMDDVMPGSDSVIEQPDYEVEDVEVDENDLYPEEEDSQGLSTLQKGAVGLSAGLAAARLLNRKMFSPGRGRAPRVNYTELMSNKNTIPRYKGFVLGEGHNEYTGPSRVRPVRDLVTVSAPIAHTPTIGSPRSLMVPDAIDVEFTDISPREVGYTRPAGLLTTGPTSTPLLGPGKIKKPRKPRPRKPRGK